MLIWSIVLVVAAYGFYRQYKKSKVVEADRAASKAMSDQWKETFGDDENDK